MAETNQLALGRTINPAQHAAIDYGVAAAFLMLGLRYRAHNRPAAALAFVNSGMVLATSMMTDYPGGVWRLISFKAHGVLDGMQAALTALGPLMLGFSDRAEAKTFYAQAASECGVIALTNWDAAPSA